jgi:predicted nucleic acid-binding protein
MNGVKAFFDTNVLLYMVSADLAKAERAETLLAAGGVISVQVLNEFAAVALRKRAMRWPEIRETLSIVRAVCVVVPLSIETHERGLAIAERYGFSIYDSCIIAASVQAGCVVLYSEDMQHGQAIEKVVIRNPFSDICHGHQH